MANKNVVTLDSILNANLRGFNIGSDVLKAAMEKRAESARNRALDTATEMLAIGERMVTEAVTELRTARQVERRAKQRKDEIVRLMAFFAETGNFFPLLWRRNMASAMALASTLGMDDEALRAASIIPEDWSPKTSPNVAE